MASEFIPVKSAISSNLVAPDPPKEHKAPAPKTEKYTRTYLKYNFGTAERPNLGSPNFELSRCFARVKLNEKGKWKLNVNIKNQEDMKGLNQLYMASCVAVEKYKASYGLRSFTAANPGEFRGLYFYIQDKNTGQISEGSDPIMSFHIDNDSIFKVMDFELDGSGQMIIDPKTGIPKYTETPKDWHSLKDTSFECVPIFCFRDLYHNNAAGSLPIPSLYVRSCLLLTPPSKKNSVDSKKSSTVSDILKTASPEELNALVEYIKKMKMGQSSESSLFEQPSAPTQAPAPSQQQPSAPAPQPSVQGFHPGQGGPGPQMYPQGPYQGYAPQGPPGMGFPQTPAGMGFPQTPSMGHPQFQQPSQMIDLSQFVQPQGPNLSLHKM